MIEDIRYVQRNVPLKTGEKVTVRSGNVTSIQDETQEMLARQLQVKINGQWQDVEEREETS